MNVNIKPHICNFADPQRIPYYTSLLNPLYTFRCEPQSEGRMILHYYSVREGLHPIVIGM